MAIAAASCSPRLRGSSTHAPAGVGEERDQAAAKPAGSRREGHARDRRPGDFVLATRRARIEATGRHRSAGPGVQVADARSITASSQRPGWPRATRPSAVAWKPMRRRLSGTRDDAPNVDVEGRHRHAVRRRGDCAGRVAADAGSRCRRLRSWARGRRGGRRSTRRSRAGSMPACCTRALPKPRAVRACSRRRGHRPSANDLRSAAMPDQRVTPVCWLMTSATRTSHGVAASRIRRGRRVCACQRKSRS